MKNKTILILAGDGIGPEVMRQAIRVLDKISKTYQQSFDIVEGLIGGAAFTRYQSHFPEETKKQCGKADAILFGSVGGPHNQLHLPQWENCEKNSILALRKHLQLNVNIRPVQIYPALTELSPLKSALLKSGVDFIIVRELMGDIYFGAHKEWLHNGIRYASDLAEYNEEQISSVAHHGFQLAMKRQKRLTLVDKANVLDTSKLWRKIIANIAIQYPEVVLDYMLVDNCAMQMIINPTQFDVILTSNLFGDILSDEGAAITGSVGLMPSASLNANGFGLYEPAGGSAHNIAGKNSANPIAQILSAALMLRYSFGLTQEANAIENAVRQVLIHGYRTQDILTPGSELLSTSEITDKIIEYLN